MSHVLRGTYSLIPSAKYHQCQQLPNQCSLFPFSWLTPTVHPLLHKEVHTSCPASSYCAMFDCLHYWPLLGLCDFCLENSSMELRHCPGHGTDSICKDPVWTELLMKASRAAALSTDEDLVLPQLGELWVVHRPLSLNPKGVLGWLSLVSPIVPIAGIQGLNPISNPTLSSATAPM